MHDYHDEGLDQQCGVVAGAGPVEDFEDGGCEHDEGDVEGEAGGGAGAVDGEDLVRVRGYGGEDEAAVVLVFDRGIVGPSCDGRIRTILERKRR